MSARLWIFVAAAFAIVSPARADSGTLGCPKVLHRGIDHAVRSVAPPLTQYPKGQESMLGEGWVLLRYSITPTGDVANIKLVDFVGAPIFAHQASGALSKAKFAPMSIAGKSIEFNSELAFNYRIEGKNRAGVHAKISGDYDVAASARKVGNYQLSLRVLQGTSGLTLNLYEYTLTSYGMAMSYLGLGDWRRALQQLRRTAISDGDFVDTGLLGSTFALLAELEARDNNPRAALCAFDVLKRKRPAYDIGEVLRGQIAAADQSLKGTEPVRSEVEIIDTGHDDMISPRWSHVLLRRTFQFSAVQGAVKSFELVCPTHIVEGSVTGSGPIEPDQSVGACTLNVYGEPGARFVLEER